MSIKRERSEQLYQKALYSFPVGEFTGARLQERRGNTAVLRARRKGSRRPLMRTAIDSSTCAIAGDRSDPRRRASEGGGGYHAYGSERQHIRRADGRRDDLVVHHGAHPVHRADAFHEQWNGSCDERDQTGARCHEARPDHQSSMGAITGTSTACW